MNNMKYRYLQVATDLERVFEYYEDQPDQPYLGEDKRRWNEIMEVYHLSSELIKHNFIIPFNKKISYRSIYTNSTDLGRSFIKFLERIDYSIVNEEKEFFYDPKDHDPQMELISKIANAALSEKGAVVDDVGFVPPLPIRPDEYEFLVGGEVDVGIIALNDLVLTMRTALLSSGMRDAVKSFRRNATERYKQLMRVAEQGWTKHNKNLLIRLDWSYKKKYPAIRMRFHDQNEFEYLINQVDGYRRKMLKILRGMFGKQLTFYAWKIECQDVKGLHIHWLIAVNGSEHQDRINVARQITNRWDESIGDGKTYTFNVC